MLDQGDCAISLYLLSVNWWEDTVSEYRFNALERDWVDAVKLVARMAPRTLEKLMTHAEQGWNAQIAIADGIEKE